MASSTTALATWALVQTFPLPHRLENTQSLLQFQAKVLSVRCGLYCNGHELNAYDDDYDVRLTIVHEAQCPQFQLEFFWRSDQQDHKPDTSSRKMSAAFLAYDENGKQFESRVPHEYSAGPNPAPPGPLSFSSQLEDVQCRSPDQVKEQDGITALERVCTGDLNKSMVFSWRGKSFPKLNLGLRKSQVEAQEAAQKFENILRAMDDWDAPIYVICSRAKNKGYDRMLDCHWPRFASLPSPTPPSYFAWLKDPSAFAEPDTILNFCGPHFENDRDYIDRALAHRTADRDPSQRTPGQKWWTEEQVDVVPQPLKIQPLPRVDQYISVRQYLFYVLGSASFEHQYSASQLCVDFDGSYECDVIADQTEGSNSYDFLLNLRVAGPEGESAGKAAARESAEVFQVQTGEPVRINVQLDKYAGLEAWSGVVIDKPAHYTGCNTVVRAQRPAKAGGKIVGDHHVVARFEFGHIGTPMDRMQRTVLQLMLDRIDTDAARFFKTFLLAHDSYDIAANGCTEGLPSDWKQQVDTECQLRGLNIEQAEAVKHFFSHRVTIVRGPPGTGKSFMAGAIMKLLEKFEQQFWTCTDSNKAVDLLVDSVCEERRSDQPTGYYRVRPAFREGYTPEEIIAQAQNRLTWPGASESTSSPYPTSRPVSYRMSLEETIRHRLQALKEGGLSDEHWDGEKKDLNAFREAIKELTQPRVDGAESDEQWTSIEKKTREEFRRCLLKLQKGYTNASKGIFSTAAATSGPFIRNFKPAALIIDEASQMMEANTVFAIAHGLKGQKLNRVLIIGDDKQLPPVLLAPRNPASENGNVSMMERLISTGVVPIELREQYRMHPDISRVVNAFMYGGNLRDAAKTAQRPQVAKFQTFLGRLADATRETFPSMRAFNSKTSSVLISPSSRSDFPRLGSEQMAGSTSSYNMQTASMVLRTVDWMTKMGNFNPSEIFVTSFYKDQVHLLEALLDKAGFPEVRIGTVDGSQGDEECIHIIDCVRLGGGAAPKESMGFLGSESRRWNVAMSRAMCGRILICSEMFISESFSTGPWLATIEDAKQSNTVLPDALYHTPWPNARLREAFEKVRNEFMARARRPSKSEAPTAFDGGSELVATVSLQQRVTEDFCNACPGCTYDDALRYLERALQRGGSVLQTAVHMWYDEHASASDDEDDIEPVPR